MGISCYVGGTAIEAVNGEVLWSSCWFGERLWDRSSCGILQKLLEVEGSLQ
jgi:hypothetical protein